MSARLKGSSETRSRQLFALMHSLSIDSYENTFPVLAMKTTCECGPNGLKVTGSDGMFEVEFRKKWSLISSDVARGRPVTGSGQANRGGDQLSSREE